ncbi:hypothetical protein JMT66_23705 (plasmid) [Kosakonia cowanii]|uniref:hypothetical protein n=1 Tax=Kosakonia cowanii TaxID=208223 RepID=UPI001E317AC2|nr:hypothetical protein [Kosakonia cowanii]UGS48551.1 hypothetical protein JMT66_23705 [Kosakonia cowanii]
MSKKKKGSKISGDPRKRAAAAALKEQQLQVRVLKVREFIDMNNPDDIAGLQSEALDLKSEDITEDFLHWYQSKTNIDYESMSGLSFLCMPFFDALLETGEKDISTGVVNLDEIATYLKDPANTPSHMPAIWDEQTHLHLMSVIKEFLELRGYLDDFDEFRNIEPYKEKVLEQVCRFYGDEPAVFSLPGNGDCAVSEHP